MGPCKFHASRFLLLEFDRCNWRRNYNEREGRECLQDRCVDADKWKTNAWYNNYWVCRCFINVVVLYLNLNLNVRFFLKMKCTDRWPQTIAMIRKTYRHRRNRILNLRHQITYTFFKILENFGRSSIVTAISTFFLIDCLTPVPCRGQHRKLFTQGSQLKIVSKLEGRWCFV